MIQASRGSAEPFDGVAELWFDRATLSREVSEEVLAASIRLLQDEATFIDLAAFGGVLHRGARGHRVR